jgi:prepilin-type N-terminal cleavage/methylation domain-containing protein
MCKSLLHTQRRSARTGFTLLELMIVMTILAVITATVTPVFSGTFNEFKAENETRDLVSFMEYAQNRAVTDVAEYRVFLVPAMSICWLERAIVRDGVSADFEVVKDDLIEERLLPDLVEMAVPQARRFQGKKVYYISFYPNGMCDDARVALKYVEDDSIFLISTEGSRIRWVKGETS